MLACNKGKPMCTFLVIALLASGARADAALAAARTEIIAITQALFAAIGDGKPEVWQRKLLDDAWIIDEFGRRQDKAEAVKSIHPFPAGMSGSIQVRDPHVRIYGETAVIDCEAFEREDVFGQELVVRYIASSTFLRRSGTWKLASMITVTLPTQPPALAVRDLTLTDYPGTYRYGPGRAYDVALASGKLVYTARAGANPIPLEPLAKDVFMEGGDERNLIVFRRNAEARIEGLIERRKFNDLFMRR